jgi:hypothetical protein
MNRWHALAGFLVLSMLFPPLILLGKLTTAAVTYLAVQANNVSPYAAGMIGFFGYGFAWELFWTYGAAIACWVNAIAGIVLAL